MSEGKVTPPESANPLRVGIAGAGIAGRLVALALIDRGHQVTLFDKDPHDAGDECRFPDRIREFPRYSACSYTAAGMLTPWSEAEFAEPLVFALGLDSLAMWPALSARLGGDVHYRTGGSLVVAHRQDQPDFNRFAEAIRMRLDPADNEFTLVQGEQLAALEPELAGRFHRAVYLPGEAWVCACCVMPALRDVLFERGVHWHTGAVVESIRPGEISVQRRGGGETFAFDLAIDCRGLGARQDLGQLRGVRGELLWVKAPDVRIHRLVRLMHPRYRLYIVPRCDDLYLIGATQIESEDYSEISVQSALELLSAAYSLHPGFGEARVVKTDVNCRPALPDNQPLIAYADGLLRVNGLYRHGYLMGPAIAREVTALAEAGDGHMPRYEGLIRHAARDARTGEGRDMFVEAP